jgi:hypothetical protein
MKSLFLRSVLFVIVVLFPCWEMIGGAQGVDTHPSHAGPGATQSSSTISIPGTLRSFLRMAAISTQGPIDDVVPLLAHNVAVEGYTYNRKGKGPDPTEYLNLLKDYIKQARELVALAGSRGVIRISNCDQAGPLLKTLGYDLAAPCGPDTSIETADRERAFLTDDSGFPLTALEKTLRGGEPFEYAFSSFKVPVLFSQSDWTALDPNKKDDLLDALLSDPRLARLYWSMARMDRNTRDFLRQSPGLKKLLALAPALDFYGDQIMIQSGRVRVPGGTSAEPAWKKLVGASPDSPGEFVTRLLSKDEGWLAAYFDVLSRADSAQQAYLTEPQHLQSFYEALIGKSASPGAARPVFRPAPGLVLLVSGIRLDTSGKLRIPGSLAAWKEVLNDLHRKDHSKLLRKWSSRARTWNDHSQLLASMFAFSRMNSEDGPLQAYLALNAIDRGRSTENRLSSETVRLLANDFSKYGDQYLTFSEFPLSNQSIARFMETAEAIDNIHDRNLRSDALGIFQSNVGLWKILARQGEIREANWNHSWQEVVNPFADIRSSDQLYHAARRSLGEVLQASAGQTDLSQNEIIDLLAGPQQATSAGKRVRTDLANKIRLMMAAQRLVSLDTLFALGNGLDQMAHGKTPSMALIPMTAQLRQYQLPKPLFTRGERAEWSMGLYENQHIQAEMHTDLAKVIKVNPSARKLAEACGQLVPFLRDTLVGLNYAYYETPGAQMIYNNTLFVRSHDFSGERTTEEDRSWKTPELFGRGLPAGGGTHLVGSLANLPYVLAEVEEDFIVPRTVQSLIWEDLVPTFLMDAVVPRWWRVTQNELHSVALYQRYGEELVRAAGTDSQVRQQVMEILSDRMLPRRFAQVGKDLSEGRSNDALAQLTPGDTFCLATEFRRKFPSEDPKGGQAKKELDELAQRYPEEVSWKRLSEDFGVPHPALDRTDARSVLLNVKPFPTYLGYSSRLLAESWDSNNLYWARLADEKGYPPVMLNLLIPEMTYRMVENIAATYLDDWPALLRSLQKTGKEFQEGKFAFFPNMESSSGF